MRRKVEVKLAEHRRVAEHHALWGQLDIVTNRDRPTIHGIGVVAAALSGIAI